MGRPKLDPTLLKGARQASQNRAKQRRWYCKTTGKVYLESGTEVATMGMVGPASQCDAHLHDGNAGISNANGTMTDDKKDPRPALYSRRYRLKLQANRRVPYVAPSRTQQRREQVAVRALLRLPQTSLTRLARRPSTAHLITAVDPSGVACALK